ncbi:peptidylprolyl isomerase [Isosphaeraceae bacterium EP7]
MHQGRPMTITLFGLAAATGLALMFAAGSAEAADAKTIVVFDTSAGPIEIEVDGEKAPISAANFLKYVDSGFYDNLIFHRVIPGFMVQGGGMDDAMKEKSKGQAAPIKNESGNGLKNSRGALAMARTNDPDSATNQFFINLVDNDFLDKARYAVFGKVISGMDTVDAIAKQPTATKGFHENVPTKPIYIKSAKRKAS